jgi:tetratricopeptide (TPR) repeat protein
MRVDGLCGHRSVNAKQLWRAAGYVVCWILKPFGDILVAVFMNEEETLKILKDEDPALAATAEAMLWRMWCRSGDSETDRIFRSGVEAMQQGKLAEAETLYSRVIQLAPDFAEGWNKRATVRYMMQHFGDSIADCQETLARNPNHFGAACGQGLCHMSLNQYREAAVCFRRALEIHPHLEAVRHNLAMAESQSSGNGGYLH